MIIRFSWKRILTIGTVVVRILYILLRVFSDPEAWIWTMGVLASLGFMTLTEDQQMTISKAGTSFCSFVLHFWSNVELQPPT
jgi:hypothetical protein